MSVLSKTFQILFIIDAQTSNTTGKNQNIVFCKTVFSRGLTSHDLSNLTNLGIRQLLAFDLHC